MCEGGGEKLSRACVRILMNSKCQGKYYLDMLCCGIIAVCWKAFHGEVSSYHKITLKETRPSGVSPLLDVYATLCSSLSHMNKLKSLNFHTQKSAKLNSLLPNLHQNLSCREFSKRFKRERQKFDRDTRKRCLERSSSHGLHERFSWREFSQHLTRIVL